MYKSMYFEIIVKVNKVAKEKNPDKLAHRIYFFIKQNNNEEIKKEWKNLLNFIIEKLNNSYKWDTALIKKFLVKLFILNKYNLSNNNKKWLKE